MGSSLSTDGAAPPTEVLAALAYLESCLQAALTEGILRRPLHWTAALDNGKRPWLAQLDVESVEELAASENR